MTATEQPTPVLDTARASMERAARAAAVTVSSITDLEGIGAASDLWQRVWDRAGAPPVSRELLRALTHGGSYLAGALRDARLVGAIAGFFTNPEAVRLHSHILGVDRTDRVGGVGFALKLHQRLWALEHGIESVTWTFDPLVRANAFFNIAKLGALGTAYHVDFYGPMGDAINGDGASDRLLVTWPLLSAQVERACAGSASAPDAQALRRRATAVALSVGEGERPALGAVDGDAVLCQVPQDIVDLRRRDAELARSWRLALRETLLAAFGAGLVIRGATRDGWYLLGPSQDAGLEGG